MKIDGKKYRIFANMGWRKDFAINNYNTTQTKNKISVFHSKHGFWLKNILNLLVFICILAKLTELDFYGKKQAFKMKF